MKRTVGIITIFGLNNYGNRLQNYAVQKILTNLGNSVKTFALTDEYNCFTWKTILRWKINHITNYLFSPHPSASKQFARTMVFREFTKRYIPTEEIHSLEGLGDREDYFVVGSDQVWNPTWYGKQDKDLFLLSFSKPEQRVSFAASFGVDTLPEEWKEHFRRSLSTFSYISVREEAGAKIVKELTGRDAEVLVDPTLMLSADDWLKIAEKPRRMRLNKKYILTYFLGDIPQHTELLIEKLQEKDDYYVYHLAKKEYPDLYLLGPSEFLYLISKSSLVLTDSFHACIFSFLFSKPFLVYDRRQNEVDMTSRLHTLLSNLDLERKYEKSELYNELFECDYLNGMQRLLELKEKELTYLQNAFREIDETKR